MTDLETLAREWLSIEFTSAQITTGERRRSLTALLTTVETRTRELVVRQKRPKSRVEKKCPECGAMFVVGKTVCRGTGNADQCYFAQFTPDNKLALEQRLADFERELVHAAISADYSLGDARAFIAISRGTPLEAAPAPQDKPT